MYICVYFAYIYYEGKWQGCHSERPSQVGGVGQQEPYEIQRGQMQSPASGKEETLAAIQAGAAWQGCVFSGSSVAQQQPQTRELELRVTQGWLCPHPWGTVL